MTRNNLFQLKEYFMIIILDFRLEFSARNFRQFYNGEKIPLPCFGSPELLDECGGEFAWVAAAVEVAEFYDNFMKHT